MTKNSMYRKPGHLQALWISDVTVPNCFSKPVAIKDQLIKSGGYCVITHQNLSLSRKKCWNLL